MHRKKSDQANPFVQPEGFNKPVKSFDYRNHNNEDGDCTDKLKNIDNNQLVNQLYTLLSNQDVRNNISPSLYHRVGKILFAVQTLSQNQSNLNHYKNNQFTPQKTAMKPNKVHQKVNFKSQQFYSNQNSKKGKPFQDQQTPLLVQNFSGQKLFYAHQTDKQNSNIREKRVKTSVKKFTQNQKVLVENQRNKIKVVGSQKSLSVNKKNFMKNRPKIKIIQLKQKNKNLVTHEKSDKALQINKFGHRSSSKQSKNLTKKKQACLNKVHSMNTTLFTTRNMQKKPSLVKQSERIHKSKSLSKIGKVRTESSAEKIQRKSKQKYAQMDKKRHNTEQQKRQNQLLYNYYQCQDQQELFSQFEGLNQIGQNKKMSKHSNERRSRRMEDEQIEQNLSAEFIQKISNLQKSIQAQEQQLQIKLKSIKNDISIEKQEMNAINDSIHKIREEEKNIMNNNIMVGNKKKQIHKKLQHTWQQVKQLNSCIKDITQQNQQVLTNLSEQKQLIEMYQTVIEELKKQLKIETDDREDYKKQLKLSKKNEQAFRMKANSTKSKTEIMLANLRDSISKWAP